MNEAIDHLIDLLSKKSTLYLDELQYVLQVDHGIYVHESTIWCTISQKGFRKKVTQRIAIHRDRTERQEFHETIRQYEEDDLVFVDEATCHGRQGSLHSIQSLKGEVRGGLSCLPTQLTATWIIP